jgi:hypothetical protein
VVGKPYGFPCLDLTWAVTMCGVLNQALPSAVAGIHAARGGIRLTKGVDMKPLITAVLTLAFATSMAFAQDQDWYHDREARYQGDQWRGQIFADVRSDLDHIWSARGASEKENTRLDKTKGELTTMQADLDQGRFDNGLLNDVIDSIKKSADDQRLSPRDREVLSDDLARLHDYQVNHNHWK